MGMWRSLHPFSSADTDHGRGRNGSRRKKATRRSAEKALKRRAFVERFEERAMLSGAPMLISIVANSGDVVYSPNTAGQVPVLHTAPQELDLTFNQGAVIDPTTLGGIQVVGAGADGKLDTPDDVAVKPGYVGIGGTPNEVVLRFDQTLTDGEYQITLLGSGPTALADTNSPPDLFSSGNAAQPNLQVDFTVDTGPQVVSVVPEPVAYNTTTKQLQQNTNEIDVYFNKAIQPLAQTVNQLDPRLFQLIVTGNTANTTGQSAVTPSSVSFDSTSNKATLLFADPLSTYGTGAMRLRIGNDEQVVNSSSGQAATQPLTTAIPEPGPTFGDASQPSLAPTVVNLESTPQTQHQVIDTVLGATSVSPDVSIPGGNTGVGVRNDPVEQHIDYSESPLGQGAFAAQPTPGTIPTYTYNFPLNYGGTAVSPLTNVITSAQENLARQIFQLWANYLGVQFKEVSDETLGAADFGIVTGQVQAVNATVSSGLDAIAGPAPNSPNTVNGVPEYLAVMNAQVYANESLYGGPWFTAAMQQTGRLLGLGYDAEGPPGTIMGLGGNDPATGAAPEPVYPGNADILHGQSIYTPQSDNVDMYQFTLHSAGQFSAETIAQRGLFNVITVPSTTSTGAVGAGVVDGSTFTVTDGTQTLTFEFTANGQAAANGHNAIAYNTTDTAQTVAADIAKAINGAANATGLNVSAGAYANQVDLSGPVTVTPLDKSFNLITVPSTAGVVGTEVVDGSTFTISGGTQTLTFEFAANGRTVTDGNVPIAYNSTDSAATVAGDIVSAINTAATKAGLNALASVFQNQVEITGPVTVTPATANLNSITVPSATGPVGNAVVDGSIFSVSEGTQTLTFEFAANGRQLAATDTNTPIAYNTTDTGQVVANDIANAITAAAANAGLQLVVTVQSNVVDVSGPVTVTPSGSQGQVSYALQVGQVGYSQSSDQVLYSQQPSQLNSVLTLYGQSNVIQIVEPQTPTSGVGGGVDTGTLTLNDGTHPQITFEFAANGRAAAAGNVAIDFSTGDSAHQVAVDVANAINAQAKATGLDVTATVAFDQVVLSGPVTVTHNSVSGVTYSVSRQIISRNDDYYGNDSLLQTQLAPGTYYLAVSSTGNTQFNPAVAGSGYGGTTQGPYQLQLDFTRGASGTLTDVDGNPLVGNSEGTGGGAYNFWFDVGNTIFVDKAPPNNATTVEQVDGTGNVLDTVPLYTTVSQALQVAADRLIAPAGGAANLDGQTFVVNDGQNAPVTFEFAADGRQVTDGNVAVNFNSGAGGLPDTATQVAQGIVSAIQDEVALGDLSNSVSPVANGNVVDVTGAAFVDAKGSPALMASPKIVRVLGTAGPDNSIGVPVGATVAGSIGAGTITINNTSKPTFQITSGSLMATFEFVTSGAAGGNLADGNYAVVVPLGAQAQAIAAAMAAAVNASPLSAAAGGAVLAKVSTNAMAYTGPAAWWVSLTGSGQLVINAQGTPVLSAVSNAQAYQIGTTSPAQGSTPLADGATMNIPQDVSVMVDAGAVFKLEGANISVGVNAPNVDRSQSALQVLGTPTSSVYFTSFHDNSVGSVTDTVTAPSPGDWGGIVFGAAADMEAEGAFLDSVNHARLTYAGGTVSVNGQQAAYTPIYIDGSRPAITNNTILESRDSAVSADPNSFAETVYGSPANIPGNLPSPIQTSPSASTTGGSLAAGTYYYLVTAVGPSGETAGLESVMESIGGVPTPVSRPTNETSIAVTGSSSQVTLSWYAVPGATGYKVYRGTVSGGENVLVGVVGGGSTSTFVDNGTVLATGQIPPVSQAFITDYERAGPDISGNTLAVTQPGATVLTAAAGNLILAGETFVVTNPNTGVSTVFEFVNDLVVPVPTLGAKLPDGNYPALFNPGKPAVGTLPAVPPDTAAQVAANIVSAVNAAAIGVTASAAASSAQVSISGASSVIASTPDSFTAPTGAQVTNGETFVVVNLATGVQATFEFNTGAAAAGHIGVTYTARDTAAIVASEMTAAINAAGIGVSAVTASHTLSGVTFYQVVLSGATSFQFTNIQGAGVTAVSSSTLSTSAARAITDGTTFVINNPKTGASLTFQYHLSTDTTPVTTGNIAITYTVADSNTTVATETAAAINTAGIAADAVVNGNQVSLVESATGYFASPLSVTSNVVANTLNGLFVRTQDSVTQASQSLAVDAVWTATDMPYVLSDNLMLQGNPGGALDDTARQSARLDILPGVTVKLNSARIETQTGANLIAEGTASQPIVFTSLRDNGYGGGGTFATDGIGTSTSASANLAAPGDWAGLYFSPTSIGSLDYTFVAYAGGKSTVNGNSDSFDAVEIHQATVRIADSTIENNASGLATGSRGDLEGNDAAAIYVLGAQPVVVNNVFENNDGATISINADSLTSAIVPDWGRSTGSIDRFTQFDTNDGPLVRLNKIGNTLNHVAINGMLVRPGTLDTPSVWDDTDIVHVVEGPIVVPNVDTTGGLKLESSSSASLVVKLSGQNAGFTATGTPLDITNRVGGSVQVLGMPDHPVILTALTDSTAGAGLTPDGRTQYDSNNTGVGGNVNTSGIPTFPPSGKQLAVTTTTTAATLVNAMLLRPLATGVTITSSSLVSANPIQQGTYANGDGVPLQIPQMGTILTTGNAQIPDQNTSPDWTGAWNGPGDPRLSALIGGTATNDANELTINFTVDPNSGIKSGKFEFQFGSEEYPDFVGSPFNDILAGFINGDQTTNFIHDSKGNLVSINSAFFNLDNSVNPATGKSPYNIEYNGLTSGLVASFPVQPGANTLTIAIADASDDLYDSGVLMTDLHFSTQSVGAGGVTAGGASAGAWNGITLDQYSNDNNVATVNETEPAYTGGVNSNGTPTTAQPLGQLAPNLTSGDDNQRLGFVVNGTISPDAPSDTDVYSFQAQPGTQVWMSLGNTSPGLDSVLELVDANGTVLARSNDASQEALNPSLLTTAPPTGTGFPGNLAQPLAGSTLLNGNYDPANPGLSDTLYSPGSLADPGQRNLESTNQHDPGFRVILPVPSGGSASGTDQYFVRVRSLGANINNLQGGQSSGAYQLTIGLQEAPLPPGSTVQYADIRYATNGITVQGLPDHSPLIATSGQATNPASTTDASAATQPNPLPTAQNLGNLLATDQNNISVSGSLTPSANNASLSTQVDWYTFSVNYNLVQLLQGSTAADKTFAAMFDIDYADGLQRANTTISVYNSAGQLIYIGRNSNVADDQSVPGAANGLSELTNGSMGQNDPFVGSVQLPAGEQGGTSETYYVAISSSASLPTAIDGTFTAGSANAEVRLEPIDSVNRVAEDHIGSQGGETAQPASSLTPLFNGTVDTSATNFIPTAPIVATPQQTQQIASLNTSAVPFTLGNVVLFVSQSPYKNASGVLQPGHLETVNPYSGSLETDVGPLTGSGSGFHGMAMRNDGELFGLTLGTTDFTSGQWDQIDTGTGVATQVGTDSLGIVTRTNAPNGLAAQNIGVQVQAMAYVQNGITRQLFAIASYPGDPYTPNSAFTNGLYQLDPNTGAVIGLTTAMPRGGADPSPYLGNDLMPASVSPPEQITGLASIGSQLYAITNKGGLYLINNPSGAASLQFIAALKDANGNTINFTSLTAGPPDVSNGAYANDLFGVDATGRLYVFNTSGLFQNVLAGGLSSVSLGTTNVTGLAFSTLDYNLWHVTDARANDPGHGINTAPDNSRNSQSANQPSAGNLSYYFGLENPNAAGVIDSSTGTSLQPGAADYATNVSAATGANNVYGTYNLPGGALGSLQTNSFSLANYNAGDLPTLYFDYYLDSGITATNPWKSSARVMVSTDGGNTWSEVATNDPTSTAYNAATDPRSGPLANRQNSQSSELPGFDSASATTPATTLNGVPVVDPRQQVQQLFDGTGEWRQARIDLSNYAGQGKLMLRFDFSSAGALGPVTSGTPGDKFGNYNNPVRGQNNQHEGFYVDDVTVGFAERGEMVTNNSANTQYFTVPQSPNPNAPTQNLGGAGPYQLDIRGGTEYGVSVGNSSPDISLVHSYDTNDRLTNAFSILAPAGAALTDGATFQVSDATGHTVTFQFHLSTDNTSVAPGNVAVPYSSTSTAAQVAANIAAAVNGNTTLVGASAGTIQNTVNGATVVTGSRVNLFGVSSLTSPQALVGTLTTSVGSHTLVEGNQATTTVTVSRSGSPANPVSVTVSAFDVVDGKPSTNVQFIDPTSQTLLGSSTTVLIPAGQTSATLTIQEVEQTVGVNGPELADGPQKVQIVATAKSYGSNADTLDVVDNSTTLPTLTLSVSTPSNAIITENAGANAAQLVVSRNTPTDVPLVVTLTSLDPASATVPATVTILAGSTSAAIPVTAVDDNILRTQPVNVTFVASALNFNPGTTSITVNDDNDSDPKLGTPLWQPVGPTTITGGRVTNVTDLSGNLTNPVDGAVSTVLAPPASANEPNTMYLGAVNGGIWKTTNANAPGGPTWTPLTDGQSVDSLSISDLQFGTTNGQFNYNNLIAGVGHVSDFANTGGNLIGVMTSPDGGASWQVITPNASSAVTPVGQNITSVAERDNVIMAGTAANSGTVGLLRSTDSGGTWVLVSSQANSGLPAGPVSDLVGDPADPKRFYVAVLGQGIFTSDDNGGTWANVTPTGLVLNANPSGDDLRIADNGTAVYFGYEKFNAATGATNLAAIYRSPTTGLSAATWTAMDLPTTNINGTFYGLNPEGGSDSNAPGGQKIIHFSIVADPTNPNVVYVGGDSLTVFPNSVGSVALTGRLFRGDASRPSGSQWTPITDNYTANHSAPHSDSRGMTFLGGELVEADDGGVYALSNPTTSTGAWTSLIGNLDATEIHDVAYDTNTNTVIAGTQDTGTAEQKSSTSTVYNEVNQLNGGAVAVDNSTPGTSIRYTSSSFLGGGPGGFQASTYDANGNLINTTSPALVVTAQNLTLYQTDPSLPYVTTVVLNSLNPKQMLIGGQNAVYESLDGGQTLTSLGVGGAGAGALEGAALAYGGSLNGQADTGVLWIGIGKQVYMRSAQGGAVVATNYASTAGAGNVRALAIDPTDWQTAVIVDDAGNVWLTNNSGQSFTNITGNLVSSNGSPINLYSVALVPLASTNLIYVGAQDGVYQMQTANPDVWSRYGASMPDVPVLSLEYVAGQQQYLPAGQQPQLLVAGTLGRGAYLASAIGAAGDLTITLNQQTVSDDFNATTGTGVIGGSVTRSGTLGDLPVFIQSSDPAVVPPISVIIPDGQSSANFTIDVNDLQDASGNDLAVPRETVILTPQAAGTNSIGTYVNISDDGLPTADDNPALTVTLPANQMNPSLGSTTMIGTVSRNTPTDQPLLVTLVSSDPERGSVLQANGTDTVLIPAGQSSASFTLTAVDQFVSDGNPEWVSVTAFAVSYQGLGIVSANADGNHDQSFSVEISPTQHLITYNHQGDSNVVPLQGQVIIQDNRISNSLNYGIVVQAAPRDAGGSTPYPGVPMNFQPLNTDGVVPGATITNNLLVGNSRGGVSLVGDSNTDNVPTAVVPIARVLNNTIYGAGTPAGVGVNVGVNVSPTILNNIFANLATGVSIDPTSPSTVLEGSVYQNDTTNLTGTVANGGDLLSYNLSATDPLFTSAAGNDFYLAPGSKAIDSAINQLNPRSDLATAESLTGIAPSPTVAPAYDLYGQLRTADPQTNPSGVGSTLFKSRGAIESIDFTGPTAVLANPIDNGSADQDPTPNVVHLVDGPLANFAIQLTDSGTGVDDSTVTSTRFDLYRNGVKLTAGVDYFFQYDTNTKTVYFIPATGSWATGNQYTVYVDNGVKFDALSAATPVGIKDTAGNLLQANSSTGYTEFQILLQQSTGDAPTIGVPPLQTVNENGDIATSLTFSSLSATPNPITIYDIDAPNDSVTAVLTAPNGTLSVAGVKGSGTTTVQFTRSDGSLGTVTVSGSGTGTLTLVGLVSDVNTVLNGFTTPTTPPAPLTFVPAFDFRGPTSITVSVTDANLGTSGMTGTNAASIEVAPVNQKPVIHMPAAPFSTTENPARALVITGVSVSDVDNDPTVNGGVEQVTITVPNGTVTLSTTSGLTFSQGIGTGSSMVFSGTLANINAALNGMLFLPASNFTGSTTIGISVDDLGNSPAPPATGIGNVPINVIAVNQPPDVIQPIPPVVVNETNQVGVTTVINLSQYISDPDVNNNPPEPAPTLSVVGNSNPTLLSAVIDGQILTITYAPYERGSATITILATDNNPGASHPSIQTTVSVTVNPVNFPPVTSTSDYIYTPGRPLIVTAPGVLAADVDHDNNPLKAVLTQVPAHGQLAFNVDGSFSYTPDPGFNGRDSFTYVADDGLGHRVPATVYLDTPNSRYVASVYLDVLGREPDAGGVAYWTQLLDAGTPISAVAEAIAHSAEYYANFVIKPEYLKLLGRPADDAGVAYWTAQMQNGLTDQELEAGFVASDEFFANAGGMNTAWVDAVYKLLLGRPADAAGESFWDAELAAGATRSQVALGIAGSQENNTQLINADYFHYLGRAADVGGLAYWLQQFADGQTNEDVIAGFTGSAEYYKQHSS